MATDIERNIMATVQCSPIFSVPMILRPNIATHADVAVQTEDTEFSLLQGAFDSSAAEEFTNLYNSSGQILDTDVFFTPRRTSTQNYTASFNAASFNTASFDTPSSSTQTIEAVSDSDDDTTVTPLPPSRINSVAAEDVQVEAEGDAHNVLARAMFILNKN